MTAPDQILNHLAAALMAVHQSVDRLTLCRHKATSFLDDLIEVIFPERGISRFTDQQQVFERLSRLHHQLAQLLAGARHREGGCDLHSPDTEDAGTATVFFEALPATVVALRQDAAYIAAEDPAARSVEEVILCYPGFYATAAYRIAHILEQLRVPYLPRLFTELAHGSTGIDIHPAARIGVPFLIDHGTGIVIGETSTIGRRVKLFQGVTLGALSVRRSKASEKRHPTVEDDCTVYANATILGGETVIGKGSVIGGSVWLTESVPPGSRVFHKPSTQVGK